MMCVFLCTPSLDTHLNVYRLFPCVRRISQDLAKDLAILAREIHDVAGEIDSVSSSGTAPSTTVSTAATTPGSAIDTKEEVHLTALLTFKMFISLQGDCSQ